MVIECGDPATCQAIAQQMRELLTLLIWATMASVLAAYTTLYLFGLMRRVFYTTGDSTDH